MSRHYYPATIWGALLFLHLLISVPAGAQALAINQTKQDKTNAQRPAKTLLLKDALNELKHHFRIDILFDSQATNGVQVPNFRINKQWNVEKNLDEMLTPLGLTYKKVNKSSYLIVDRSSSASRPASGTIKTAGFEDGAESPGGLNKTAANETESTGTSAQARADVTISGKVTDEAGEPLPGVSVMVKGTQQGTATSVSGEYRLTLNALPVSLVFSFVGYLSKEIEVTSQSNLSVKLAADTKALEEVVVVGYGTVKKSDLTGAVSKIGEGNIKATPIVSLDRAMQGRAAGVQVVSNSARPGGSSTIRIRGSGSVNASNDPLYVVDGFPTDNLNSINPNDIESIEILKDASATAIYGSRGSNGVVMVTTKHGKAGKTVVSYEGYYGIQSVRRKIPLLNGQQFAEFVNDAQVNNGGTPYFDGSTADRPLPSAIGEGTDWQDAIIRNAPIQNHQLGISGGSEKSRYAISFGYYDQGGIIKNSNFKRYTLRSNIDSDVSSRIKVGLTFQGAYTQNNDAQTEPTGNLAYTGVISAALNYSPTFKQYNNDGTYYKNQGQLNGLGADNPLALLNEFTNRTTAIRLLANSFVDIKIMEGLNLRSSIGADVQASRFNYYVTRNALVGASALGSAAVTTRQRLNWLNENTLNYTKTFNPKNSFSALIGYTIQEIKTEEAVARANTFSDDFAEYNNLEAGSTLIAPSSSASEWALISYLARVNYGYDDRFLLTLTGRRDGSSRFGPNRKQGFFPSGALAWKLHNEKWFSNITAFTEAKLRTSYGLSGNQEIGNYRYLANISAAPYVIGGVLNTGSATASIGNPDLRWERNAQFDIGLDLGLFRNRISISADYYYKKTSDLLFDVSVPTSSGFSTTLKNIGSVQNKGLELALNTINVDKGGLRWSSEFNITFNRNKILTLDGRQEFRTGSDATISNTSQNPILLRVGSELGNYFGLVMDGIFQNQGEIDNSAQKTAKPGDIRYVDRNGNGAINDNDRDILGSANPDFFGGINNTVSYKGFEFNVFVQGSYGNEILNYGSFDQLNFTGGNNQSARVLDRWTPGNPSNTIPRANAAGGSRLLSTLHVEDGSYLRFKNISLGYNLPQQWRSKLRSQQAKIYVAAQNLFTLTKYTGYDPEVNRYGSSSLSQGIDYGGYPAAKTILVGLNLTF
ncbi:SusC/RagA family TonB-linked outer membrane protein [Dyadobacter aurulentus]|uniref:SusC/RagA family TonB-linked outer membrane protein n=1 Tax=Dyadobacter sp. UC 10 TaxID=2605428 RepID=UPI001CED4CCA|nr:TonB-dependent receptor [Dyadobacter sp. UC 10]